MPLWETHFCKTLAFYLLLGSLSPDGGPRERPVCSHVDARPEAASVRPQRASRSATPGAKGKGKAPAGLPGGWAPEGQAPGVCGVERAVLPPSETLLDERRGSGHHTPPRTHPWAAPRARAPARPGIKPADTHGSGPAPSPWPSASGPRHPEKGGARGPGGARPEGRAEPGREEAGLRRKRARGRGLEKRRKGRGVGGRVRKDGA